MRKLGRMWKFYLGPVLTIPLVMLPWMLKKPWNRLTLLTCGLLLVALLLTTWATARYAAPITALVFVLILQAMRYLRLWGWRHRPTGRFIVRAIPILYIASFIVSFVPLFQIDPANAWSLQRAQTIEQLKADGRRHLVIVRYGLKHSPHSEWVYNEADIDGANVVWAREMDTAQNRKLLEYFKDRCVWLLEADMEEPKLVPYVIGSSP